jgi:hypothetical protein
MPLTHECTVCGQQIGADRRGPCTPKADDLVSFDQEAVYVGGRPLTLRLDQAEPLVWSELLDRALWLHRILRLERRRAAEAVAGWSAPAGAS